jgi:hypothetical protein
MRPLTSVCVLAGVILGSAISTKAADPVTASDPDLTAFEASIANNSTYTTISVTPVNFSGSFNGITWPLKADDPQCSSNAKSSKVCGNKSNPLSSNLRDIKIAGSVFVIDNSPLWQGLNGVENIRNRHQAPTSRSRD